MSGGFAGFDAARGRLKLVQAGLAVSVTGDSSQARVYNLAQEAGRRREATTATADKTTPWPATAHSTTTPCLLLLPCYCLDTVSRPGVTARSCAHPPLVETIPRHVVLEPARQRRRQGSAGQDRTLLGREQPARRRAESPRDQPGHQLLRQDWAGLSLAAHVSRRCSSPTIAATSPARRAAADQTAPGTPADEGTPRRSTFEDVFFVHPAAEGIPTDSERLRGHVSLWLPKARSIKDLSVRFFCRYDIAWPDTIPYESGMCMERTVSLVSDGEELLLDKGEHTFEVSAPAESSVFALR